MKQGLWMYFAKKGKNGQMIGNVLGRGYFLGERNGKLYFKEGCRIFTPRKENVVTYTLGGNQKISRKEASEHLMKCIALEVLKS